MQSTTTAEVERPWEKLLPELLGRIAGMCPNPADRARFRCVCRSWCLAVRHHCHCPQTSQPPWVVLSDGSFLMLSDGERQLPSAILHYFGQPGAPYFCQPSDGGPHRLVSLPENNTCVGSSGGWLALCQHAGMNGGGGGDTFLLHNPFSGTTLPLPGVDAVCAKATALGEWFRVFKVLLMRSAAGADDDIIVVVSQSRSYPFVLSSLQGKGQEDTWTPEPDAPPFMHIIDVAFVGEDKHKLYGITRAEDLFCFHLSFGNGGVPVVTRCERLIRHPLDCYYGGYFGYEYYAPWSDDDSSDEEEDDQEVDDGDSSEEEEDQDQEVDDDDGSEEEDQEVDNDEDKDEEEDDDGHNHDHHDPNPEKRLQVPSNVDVWFDKKSKEENADYVIVIRYLVESFGKKLIMVRRELQSPDCLPTYTRKVEVFEGDTEAAAWVPVHNGLGLAGDGGGQALFLSQRFSKCVSTSSSSGYGGSGSSKQTQQVDEDSIYFMDTGEAFDMKSATISPRRWCVHYNDGTWLFPPGLVV